MKRSVSISVAGIAVLLGTAAEAETRVVSPLPAPTGMSVGSGSRMETLTLFQKYYRASEGSEARMGWNGNSSTPVGVAGTTTAAYKDDVLRRINFYRALSRYSSNIVFNAAKSAECQQAALMMSGAGNLSHSPPKTWKYYTPEGAEAAANSNLALGYCGPEAIDSYMQDSEAGNEATSHRRWILYSLAVEMGTGDIPANNGKSAANALWIMGPPYATQRPGDFACFPNPGYCPSPIAPVRWSISYPGANFAAAKVSMTKNGANVATKVISDNFTGSGDSALVWTAAAATTEEGATYQVSVSGITGNGIPTSKSYSVIFFDPDNLGQTMTLSGPAVIPAQGSTFSFTPIQGAEAYQVEVSQQGASSVWSEGAEDTPAPAVISATTGTYALRETAQAHAGSKSFHLVFPSFTDQFFTVDRDIIPQATSHLTFYQLAKITTPQNTLAAEVSQDNGVSWTAVWQRNGIPSFNASEANWSPVDVNLSAYAGKTIRVRFAARYGSSSYTTPTTTYGFYIDDIAVSNTLDQSSLNQFEIPGTATSFQLDTAAAGAALENGAIFHVRIRPGIGSHWFDFTAAREVTVHATANYADWVATFYPGLAGGFTGDGDKDGISNGVEYAFALNPQGVTSAGVLPQPAIAGNIISFDYDQPDGITDVDYQAEWSDDLVEWTAMPDTGVGNHHHFQVTTLTRPKIFFRHVIEQK